MSPERSTDGPSPSGRRRFLVARGVDIAPVRATAAKARARGETVVLGGGRRPGPRGVVGVVDPIKESTREALRLLREDGVRIVMATGDNRVTADAPWRRTSASPPPTCGPRRSRPTSGAWSPRSRPQAGPSPWAGDGINDAPALAEGGGRDRDGHGNRRRHGERRPDAGSAATCAPSPAPGASAARRCATSARTSSWAFAYNAVGIPVAAGLLYPVVGLLISPIWASVAMTLSSLSVIGNALRLRRAEL